MASSAGYTLLHFTPGTAALGGLVLGVATAIKVVATGRVLGISGAVKGLVNGEAAPWRFAFLGGMLAGAIVLSSIFPAAFEMIPGSFPLWRASLAGLLVGLGAAMGNGCTSGHGICGSARLSTRSFAYTGTFMAAGMATATLTNTAAAMNVAPVAAAFAGPAAAEMQLALTAAVGGLAAFAALASAARAMRGSSSSSAAAPGSAPFELGSELLAGLLFAVGLGISGMTHPSKVAGFLTVGVPSWDASLPFVMGGAVLVAAIAFQGIQRFKMMSKPLFTPGFCIPNSSVIDGRLLTGGLLFGAGWGLAGMCPGPAIVGAVVGDPHVLAYLGSMAGGMWLEHRMSAWQAQTQKQQSAQQLAQLAQQHQTEAAKAEAAAGATPKAASGAMEVLSSAQPVGTTVGRIKRVESQMG
ncbi:hypothetical protein HYH02_005581 [Chlamydomonas schloesseri]|uniref:Sulphur transport domain-containing protein n=1 Tax=Chlamydomonas schloesseri TaxID=2026947 RepID=A0A835WLH7_9CHLO|nr:hypothetical protein HYH02_005581 [Chlamydomonas schloesseri]|eukprot:KAG2449434.1 hypothetical protein HYH02_005581 [Chlamydomonas schloesseri]